VQLQLEAISPNLRAVDHLKDVEKRLEETNGALDTMKEYIDDMFEISYSY